MAKPAPESLLTKLKNVVKRMGYRARAVATSPKMPETKAPIEWEGVARSVPYGAAGAAVGGYSDEENPLKGAAIGGALGMGHGLFEGGLMRAARNARVEAAMRGATEIPAHEAAHMLSNISLGAAAGAATGKDGEDRARRALTGAGIGGGVRGGRVLAKILGSEKGLSLPLSVPLIPAGGLGGYELSKALENEYDKRQKAKNAPAIQESAPTGA